MTAPVQPQLRLAHAAASDLGTVRTVNEDAYAVDPDLGVYAVADGLGGHQAGEVASVTALAAFLHALRREEAPLDPVAPDHFLRLVAAFDRANTAVERASLAAPDRAGMGTTLVAAWVDPVAARLWLGNVGDSRGYLMRAGSLEQLTEDDTLLEALRRAGMLPDDPLMWPPRQQLIQALGTQDAVMPRVTSHELHPRDRILLCSDGLTDMVPDDELAALLRTHGESQRACDELIGAANRNGGADNVTVVLIDAHPAGETEPDR